MKNKIFIAILIVVSAAVGGFFGLGAQILYEKSELFDFSNGVDNPFWLGGAFGIFFGAIVGALYAAKTVKDFKYGHHGHLIPLLMLAILAGVACSTLVHLSLMICYRNSHLTPALIGSAFGAASGAFMGPIAWGIYGLISMAAKQPNDSNLGAKA